MIKCYQAWQMRASDRWIQTMFRKFIYSKNSLNLIELIKVDRLLNRFILSNRLIGWKEKNAKVLNFIGMRR